MFENLLARIGRTLPTYNIPYMIIGGQALLLYGEPRLTKDIDITLGAGTDRLPDVLNLLGALGLEPATDDIESFVQRTMVLPALDTATGIRVDFIFSFTPYEKGAIARSRKVSIGGEDVAFATAEDLIIHKIFAGRPRDLEDVRSVLLRNPSQDLDYIRQWLREFDAGEEGRGFPATFEEILESVSSI
jgi:hypothetical protein